MTEYKWDYFTHLYNILYRGKGNEVPEPWEVFALAMEVIDYSN